MLPFAQSRVVRCALPHAGKVVSRLRHIFMTGRTSTMPPVSKIGQPRENSTASAMSLASAGFRRESRASPRRDIGIRIRSSWFLLRFAPSICEEFHLDLDCHSPSTAPVGSRIKLSQPMPVTSVTSFMTSAPNDSAFFVAA